MCGTDIPIEECQLILHQPTMEEISFIGTPNLWTGVQTILVSKNMLSLGETDLADITNFQIFMAIMTEKETADKKAAVLEVLNLLFPKEKIMITPRALVFNSEGNTIMVDGDTFDFLADIVREVFCINSGPMEQQTFNPANAQAKAIADKIMQGRAKVAAEKGGESSANIFLQYMSTLSIGTGIDLNKLKKYTVFQLYDSMERLSLNINWDIDIRSRLMGGSPDEPADNWMKDIHN